MHTLSTASRSTLRPHVRSTLRASFLLASVLCIGLVAFAGCGGRIDTDASTSTPSGTSTGAPTGTSPTPTATIPDSVPARPKVDTKGFTTYLSIDQRFFGTRGRDLRASSKAWMSYALDLDGRITNTTDAKSGADTCKRVSGAPINMLVDGDGGVDNNFGAWAMSVVRSLRSDFEEVDDAVVAGGTTWVLALEDRGGDDDASVPGRLYLARHPGKPAYDPTDRFQVGESISFPEGYTSGGVWVSGAPRTVDLPIEAFGALGRWHLEGAMIVLHAAEGRLVGLAKSTDLVSAMTPQLARLGICPGHATFDQVTFTLVQASDLATGAPSFQDASRTCDAISIALGFHVVPTGIPTPGYVPTAAPSPCR